MSKKSSGAPTCASKRFRTESHRPTRRTPPDPATPPADDASPLEPRLTAMFATLIRERLSAGAPLAPLAALLHRDACGALMAEAFAPLKAMVRRSIDGAVAEVKARP